MTAGKGQHSAQSGSAPDEEVTGEGEEASEGEEELRAQLGISAEEAMNGEVDIDVLREWHRLELDREDGFALPLKVQEAETAYEDDELERILLFEDVKHSVFSLPSEAVRVSCFSCCFFFQ